MLSSARLPAAQVLNRTPGWPGTTLDGIPCYGGDQGYGPYDYITEKSKIGVVEAFHFKPDTEQLNDHYARLDGDLDYTLKAIPNHHRALWARVRFYLKTAEKKSELAKLEANERLQQGSPPPECYLQRAMAFNPQDGMVPAIYGIFLHKRGMLDAALTQYQRAEEKLPNHPELVYNTGLLYFDLGELTKAREYADKARALGYPLGGLHGKISSREAEKSAESK